MRSPRLTAALAVILLLLVTSSSTFAAASSYLEWEQTFDTDTNGWVASPSPSYGTIQQVASGTGGITSASGAGHALVSSTDGNSGPFSRFDTYRNRWPGPWKAEIDVYLDPANWPTASGFDYSVATNNTSDDLSSALAHRRDFIFHVAKYDAPNRIVIAADNNSNNSFPRTDLETFSNYYTIDDTEAGWYTLQHRFYAVGGVLRVDLNLLNSDGEILFTETRTDPSDTIGINVGGNRYSWFTFIDGVSLPIDNHQLDFDWIFYDDGFPGGVGEFVVGPPSPPLGVGSLHFALDAIERMNYGTIAFAGTRLDRITELKYTTYQVSAGPASLALQFDVDHDDADAQTGFQGRLTYEPYFTQAVNTGVWQTWDTLNDGAGTGTGNWWFSPGSGYRPGSLVCPQANPCTWAEVLGHFPRASIRQYSGYLWLKAGGPAPGLDVNTDALTIELDNGTAKVYDFEPATLTINDASINMHGLDTFNVPVVLGSGHNNLSSVSFEVAWDKACLAFDSVTDADNNGVPDSVTGLPSSSDFDITVTRNGSDQEVTILIQPLVAAPPLPILAEGTVASLEFNADGCDNPPGTGGTQSVNFTFPSSVSPAVVPSFGNDAGQSVDGATDAGVVQLTFNAVPSDITLTGNTVNENLPGGTLVGTLCTADDTPNGSDCTVGPGQFTFDYSLVTAVGCTSTGNYAFQIGGTNGNQLQTAGALDREDVGGFTYNVCVRSEDAFGLSKVKSFAITVNNVNEAPTDVALNDLSVDENAAAGTAVGTLSTVDEDAGDSHTYSLCSASPQFAIDGTALETTAPLSFETQSSYNVCVRSTDAGLLFVERTFTISIVDLNDTPVAVNDPATTPIVVVANGTPVAINVLANDTDQDGDTLTVNSVTNGAHGTSANASTHVNFTAASNYNGPDSFTYTAKDPDNAASNSATVSVNIVEDDDRADCNADGQIDAADFPATVLEIFDTDASIDWWKTYTGSFAGSPIGCDSNASENGLAGTAPSVDSADIICTVLVFFGNSACTTPVSTAAVAEAATLSIPGDLSGAAGTTVAVPVTLESAGNSVAAATFALTFDGDAASFDSTDSDGNGVPDAITLNVPASMATTVIYDADANRIQVAVYGTSLPMPTLSDGVIATVELQVTGGTSGLALSQASLGSDAGQSIPVQVDGGTEPTFGDDALFLPLLSQK